MVRTDTLIFPEVERNSRIRRLVKFCSANTLQDCIAGACDLEVGALHVVLSATWITGGMKCDDLVAEDILARSKV